MNDLQPQYFTPNEAPPAPVPFWRSKNGLAVLGFGALVVVLVIIFIVNTVASRRTATNDAELSHALTDCATAKDPAACEVKARTDAARQGNGSGACKGLEGDALTGCVTLAAFASLNEDDCDDAADAEGKTSCADSVRLRNAVAQNDYGMCADIQSETTRATCQTRLLSIVVAAGKCEENGVDAAVCDARMQMTTIVDAGDYKACAGLPSPYNVDCQDVFSSVDRDGDGLTRKEEFEVGTSDDAADTDGDGYADKDEIESGHDPLL